MGSPGLAWHGSVDLRNQAIERTWEWEWEWNGRFNRGRVHTEYGTWAKRDEMGRIIGMGNGNRIHRIESNRIESMLGG